MSGGIFEEPIELHIETLEADFPSEQSYPYPSLKLSGNEQSLTLQALILENDLLRVTILPALGGRISSIFDKRIREELIASPSIRSGGLRGAFLDAGIQLSLNGAERLTSLAQVQFQVLEGDEGEVDQLWLSETTTGTGLSYHLRVWLEPASASIRLEGRAFNRTLGSVPYNPGFLISGLTGSIHSAWKRHFRFAETQLLAPHQLDTWSLTLTPFPQIHQGEMSDRVAAELVEETIKIQCAERLQGKLVLLLEDGQNLEAPLDIYPEHLTELDISSIPSQLKAYALLDVDGNILLHSSAEAEEPTVPIVRNQRLDFHDFNRSQANAALFATETRHIAHYLLGIENIKGRDYRSADHHLEQALLYNGEDHLAWLLRAILERLQEESGESQNLLNAHFLAPLEPALRAESFLRQPATSAVDPTALLRELSDQPDDLIDAACFFIESGFYRDASRWIEASLRIADLPMLRFLRAYTLLKHSDLQFEAQEDIESGSSKPLAAPYPWRAIERKAIAYLSDRFPDNERLRQLADIVNRIYLSSSS